MNNQFDVVIIGGGPGASTLASYLLPKGVTVAIVEKQPFPRFQIGESLLPSSMDIMKEIGFFPILDSGKYIRKYGAQFIDYRSEDEIYFVFENSINPNHSMAFEVRRSDFDSDLLEFAKSKGATVFQPEAVENVIWRDDGAEVVTAARTLQAKYVVDASGRSAYLGTRMKNRVPNDEPIRSAVFGHFEGVKRSAGSQAGDICIGCLPNRSWSWLIPFQGAQTSVGIVTEAVNIDKSKDLEATLWDTVSQSERLALRMKDAKLVSEMRVISNYSHNCTELVGPRWLMVGDAGAFLDPIFSTGVHLSLSAARFASLFIVAALSSGKSFDAFPEESKEYDKLIRQGVNRFHSLVRMFYGTDFIKDMKKALTRPETRSAFTSALAGDVWNTENRLFSLGIL